MVWLTPPFIRVLKGGPANKFNLTKGPRPVETSCLKVNKSLVGGALNESDMLGWILVGLVASVSFGSEYKDDRDLLAQVRTIVQLELRKAAQNDFIASGKRYLALVNKPLPGSVLPNESKATDQEADMGRLLSLARFENSAELDKQISTTANSIRRQILAHPEIVKGYFRSFYEGTADFADAELDALLGLRYSETEDQIKDDSYSNIDYNIHVPKEKSQSDYKKIKAVFKDLNLGKSDKFYDLGSGYGRVVVVGALLNPAAQFKGIEIVSERVKQAKRYSGAFKLKNLALAANDVRREDFSDGTVFYMFHPFPGIMDEVLSSLHKISNSKRIRIVATPWFTIERLLRENWLKPSKIVADPNYAIFESNLADFQE